MQHKDTPALVVEKSGNKKTGRVSATYASQSTCPTSCSFRGQGCYAEHGAMNIHAMRLNNATVQDPIEIATIEAAGIDRLSGANRLRLHVVGDCSSNKTARIVSSAAERYTARGGQPVWTYTHAWRNVSRSSWGSVSVNASCETPNDIAAAKAAGYSTVVVYSGELASKPFSLTDSNGTAHKVIPCPQQAGRNNCAGCQGLCTDSDNMQRHNITVGFHAHGAKAATVQDVVSKLNAGE